MTYTIHVGPRGEEWPAAVGSAATREAAQRLCRAALLAAPADHTKGEVRLRVALLDGFSKRPTGAIRRVYEGRQRSQS